MQLLSLIVLKHNAQGSAPYVLASSFALDSFGFFQRGSVKEVCIFVSREVVQRSTRGQMLSVKHLNYMCHTRVTPDGLAGALPSSTSRRLLALLFCFTLFFIPGSHGPF